MSEPIEFLHLIDPAGWVYLDHAASGGRTKVPADPDVIAAHEARGWAVGEPPDDSSPMVPSTGEAAEDAAAAWIDMVHPAFGGHQLLPNNAAALAGAREAGWVTAAEAVAVETADLTVAEVLAVVGTDPARAAAALAAELAGKNRSSLTSALEAIAAGPEPTAVVQDKE